MIFYGAGSTQANGVSDYGGVVYAYNEEEILFWRPSSVNVVYIGDRWGSGMSHQASTTADIIVRIFYLPASGKYNWYVMIGLWNLYIVKSITDAVASIIFN